MTTTMTRRSAIGATAGAVAAVAGCGAVRGLGKVAERGAVREGVLTAGQALPQVKAPAPASRYAELLARAREAGMRVEEAEELTGRLWGGLAFRSVGFQVGLGEDVRARILADALARPGDTDVYVRDDGGRWLSGARPERPVVLAGA